ncbi:MAG: polysaccharide deacetylase family protein [Saprospiraceae bacterium]
MSKLHTVIFFFLMVWIPHVLQGQSKRDLKYDHGAIVRGDSTTKQIAIIFSGDEYGEGLKLVRRALKKSKIKASFFFTGRFYRHASFKKGIQNLIRDGHYLGGHSDQHLLYCDWTHRDSLLVTRQQFEADLTQNYLSMKKIGVDISKATFFLPPYEWYNDAIAAWTKQAGYQLINYTPGTLSHADYTGDQDKNFRSNLTIWNSITAYDMNSTSGLNGFILLMHIGAGSARHEKFFKQVPGLIRYLQDKGYLFKTVSEMLN